MKASKALFVTTSLCTGLMLAAMAGPAWAQTTGQPAQSQQPTTPPPAKAAPAGTEVGEVIVTGSHIKTNNYNSPDPMTVITNDEAQLTGNVDTSQILQLSAVAANAVQINNFFTGFITTGGPGVNTLSLFGLGAQRTLFLINGERAGPAGVGGTVGPFDLSVIPSSMIDHTEILKDGASSVYGSDAVAGVVNFVTKTNQDGGELEVFGNPSQLGGGNEYEVSGSWGKTFDKGYIQGGFDWYRQDPLLTGERSYLNCSRDMVTDPGTGASQDIIDPTTGKDKCFNVLTNTIVDEGQYNGFVEYVPGSAGPQVPGINVAPGFFPTNLQFCGATPTLCLSNGAGVNAAATRANVGLEPENNPLWQQSTAISPVSRYSVFLFGGYDLTPQARLYGSFIFNQRDSSQNGIGQLFGLDSNSVQNPSLFNFAATTGFIVPIPVLLESLPSTQTVDYYRVVGGIRGSLPNWGTLQNWTYDLYGQYSLSDGHYTQRYIPTDRANAVFGSNNAEGCDQSQITEAGVNCVPFNLFQDVIAGGLTPQQTSFLYANENAHTTYETEYLEGSVTGDLYQLPAGPLGAALGFHVRREALDDVPGIDFINANVYNFTTEGVTKGSETVGEFYGELKIPVVKEWPFVKSFDVDLSGRFSDYNTYGSNETYKITADWAVNDWVKFRGTYGTAFRAPALYEEFLANQTGFFNQLGIDPCIEYGTSGVDALIQKNCASLGIGPNYNGQGSGLTSLTGGGGTALKPETAITDTIGVVLTPNYWGQNVQLSIDFYNADIQNQIAQFGVSNIVFACLNSTTFPNNAFCNLITRNGATAVGAFSPFNIEEVQDPYINISQELNQGLDVTLNWRNDLPLDIKMTTRSELNWTFYNKIVLNGTVVNEFLGQVGEPRFVGNVDWEFDRGDWTFNWLLYMVGHSSDNPFTGTTLFDFRGTGQNVASNYVVPFYTNSTVSIRRKFDKFTLEAGIKNLFNQAPPAISVNDDNSPGREGTTPLAISQYDLIGRSFYALIDAKF
jgi:iron complex outermembrane receptor protein